MKLADKIVALLAEKRTALSSKQIAEELFGPEKGLLVGPNAALGRHCRAGPTASPSAGAEARQTK